MSHTSERFLAGPLRWTATGGVLATWVLSTPLPIAQDVQEAAGNIDTSRGLWEALAGRRYWLESFVCWQSPVQLAEAMLAEGREQNPRWLGAVEEALDYFEERWLGNRRFLLTVELPNGLQDGLQRVGRAATNQMLSGIGVNPLPPTPQEYETALARMKQITELIPTDFGAVPATPEIIAWARREHIRREGIDVAEILPGAPSSLFAQTEGPSRLESARLDQSGMSTMGRSERITAPWRNKWVAVTDEDGETSYQAHLILRAVPRQMAWPEMEILGTIDSCGVPVNYSVVGVARNRADATARNAKAANKLTNQVDQVEGAAAGAERTHMARLASASRVLNDYSADFTDDEHLVEHEPVVVASISNPDPEGLELDVAAFMRWANTHGTWSRPIGAEAVAFVARQPGGGELPPELNTYRQVTHSITMSTMGAVTASQLGHNTGLPLWIDKTIGLHRNALWEPWGEGDTFKQVAAAKATVGKQGSGKTFYAMNVVGLMCDAGARIVATDTTVEREWSIFADSLGATVTKVDFEHPQTSIDPLRCLPLNEAKDVIGPFLSTLLDLDTDAPERLALTEVLAPRFLAEHHVNSLPDLLDKLPKARRAGVGVLGDRLELWMDADRYPALFDRSLPAAETSNQVLIWGTHGLQLPTEDELRHEHLFRKMDDSKRMGRALYSLFSWFSKSLCFRDPQEPALQNIDEFHHILASPEATRGQFEFVRLMRHVLAAVHYQTQLNEFPKDLLGLIGTRLVLNVDESNLSSSADFLLPENASEEAREAVKAMIKSHCSAGRGAGILRVHRNGQSQIGKVQTVPPFLAARRQAASASSSRETTGIAR